MVQLVLTHQRARTWAEEGFGGRGHLLPLHGRRAWCSCELPLHGCGARRLRLAALRRLLAAVLDLDAHALRLRERRLPRLPPPRPQHNGVPNQFSASHVRPMFAPCDRDWPLNDGQISNEGT